MAPNKSLDVSGGIELADKVGGVPFSWLTCTNAGATEVCKAALNVLGVTEEAVADGHFEIRLAYCGSPWRGDMAYPQL